MSLKLLLPNTQAWPLRGGVGSWQGRDSGWRPRPAREQGQQQERYPSHSSATVGRNGEGRQRR